MPLYKELNINPHAKTAIWKVQEDETFFSSRTGLVSNKKNEIKRLEHLAGRFLLQQLLPQLDFSNIGVSDLGKPFMRDHSVHFSITHSFPYIGVAINTEKEIGIDVQTIQERIQRLQYKFLSEQEQRITENKADKITLAWAAKEAAFKRYGLGAIDFIQHMPITEMQFQNDMATLRMAFSKEADVFHIDLLGGIEADFAWSVTL